MSGVLQLLLSFVELESILVMKAKKDSPTRESVPALNISSSFPRFQEIYTLGIAPVPGSAITSLHRAPRFAPEIEGGNSSDYCMQCSWRVDAFFDEDGVFAEDDFIGVVNEFVRKYSSRLQSGDWKKSQ